MKGVTGQILTVIISLILAIFAIALIWIFLTKSNELILQSVQKIMLGMKCKIFCKSFLGGLIKMGYCSGC